MCFVCGNPAQVQKEVLLLVHVVQALASVPVFAIIVWQGKNVFRSVKELKKQVFKRKSQK